MYYDLWKTVNEIGSDVKRNKQCTLVDCEKIVIYCAYSVRTGLLETFLVFLILKISPNSDFKLKSHSHTCLV